MQQSLIDSVLLKFPNITPIICMVLYSLLAKALNSNTLKNFTKSLSVSIYSKFHLNYKNFLASFHVSSGNYCY